jgi:hypothetical protein
MPGPRGRSRLPGLARHFGEIDAPCPRPAGAAERRGPAGSPGEGVSSAGCLPGYEVPTRGHHARAEEDLRARAEAKPAGQPCRRASSEAAPTAASARVHAACRQPHPRIRAVPGQPQPEPSASTDPRRCRTVTDARGPQPELLPGLRRACCRLGSVGRRHACLLLGPYCWRLRRGDAAPGLHRHPDGARPAPVSTATNAAFELWWARPRWWWRPSGRGRQRLRRHLWKADEEGLAVSAPREGRRTVLAARSVTPTLESSGRGPAVSFAAALPETPLAFSALTR